MNKFVKQFFFVNFYLLLVALQLSATTYYIDSSQGNNSYSGTSITSPWQTINKINNFHFQPGDSILFKKGQIWQECLDFPSSGSALHPIVIGSYGDGELPIITGVSIYQGWNNPANWTLEKDNIWSRPQSYNPQRLWIDGKEILRNEQIDSLDGTRYGWAWENSKIYLYSTENPAVSFDSIKTNALFETVIISNKNYITIQAIEIQGGYAFSLAIRGGSHITVKDCRVGSFSRQGIQIRDNLEISSTYVTIDNCLLDSKFHFSYGKDKGIDDGIQIVSGANDCIVKNCIIKDFGHSAIYLKALSATNNGVFNNKIFGNFISGENVTYLRGLNTDGYEDKCRDNEIFNNIIKNTTVRSQINGNNNWIHHNIINGVKNSIVKSWAVGQGIDLQGYGTDFACHDNKIDNNLIMNCDEPGITFSGNGNDKKNNYVRNNIILNCGRNSKAEYDNIGIAIENSNTIKTNYFFNNCIFGKVENAPAVFLRGNYLTVEQFNNQNSAYDIASNNIQKDPLLETSDSIYFYLTKNSPCIDAGIDVGLKYDYYGNVIYTGSAPDIGIQEYYSTTGNGSLQNFVVDNFQLFQNYPNPFNSSTRIDYIIPRAGDVNLTVYNSLGQMLVELVTGHQTRGKYSIQFHAAGLPSGVYFYKLKSGSFTDTKKLILLR